MYRHDMRRLSPQVRIGRLGDGSDRRPRHRRRGRQRSISARATQGKPYAIIARTEKGHGISFLADKDDWHGKPLSAEQLEKALAEIGSGAADRQGRRPILRAQIAARAAGLSRAARRPSTRSAKSVASREAYGTGCRNLATRESEGVRGGWRREEFDVLRDAGEGLSRTG